MSMKDFTRLENISIADISLDEKNVRFDVPPGSQRQCKLRLLENKNGEKLIKLAGHIAAHGIGLAPIVVAKDESGRYVVRDGNRRIAALTFLNNPAGCPVKNYRPKFSALQRDHMQSGNITDEVDCWLGHSEEAILEHIQLQHSGQMDGAGQVPLETSARDRLEARRKGKDSRHGQVYRWLLAHKDQIPGIERLGLTNVQRLVSSKANLMKVGFTLDQNGKIHPKRSQEEIIVIWKCLLSRVKNVASIYHKKERYETIDAALVEATGIIEAHHMEKSSKYDESPKGFQKQGNYIDKKHKGNADVNSSPNYPSSPSPTTVAPTTIPRKRSAERDYLVVERKHKIKIPIEHHKARDIVVELKKIQIESHPLAVASLFRALFEISFVAFLQAKNAFPGYPYTLNQLIDATAKKCSADADLKKRKNKVGGDLNRLVDEKSTHSIHALHKCVHDNSYKLSVRDLCSFYDDYDFYFAYWWEQVATSR